MRDLSPVRLTGGGTLLVLTDGDGVEYAVPLGRLRETLGQALDRASPEAGQDRDHSDGGEQREAPAAPVGTRRKESTMESTLRPRDIQARIRAGESAEDVAAVAGTSVDKVMIFASPVLAERAHVAQSAQSASVRRKSTEPASSVRALGAAAALTLRDEGVDPESIEWDAWRREDGRWTLQASYAHEAELRRARFSYDQPGHFVTADDDEGRWLVGDGRFPSRREQVAAQQLRLAPAYEQLDLDGHDELGDDAIEMVTEDERRADDLSATVAAVRRRVPVPAPDPEAITADADWMSRGDDPEPALGDPENPIDGASPVDEPTSEPTDEPTSGVEPGLDEIGLGDSEPTAETMLPKPAGKKARGRSSVPSWDEIMFGGGGAK